MQHPLHLMMGEVMQRIDYRGDCDTVTNGALCQMEVVQNAVVKFGCFHGDRLQQRQKTNYVND